jgi:O-antigen ligase
MTVAVDSRRPVRRFAAVWLGVGLALTSATQLRLPGLPIGPGELILLGWMLAEAVVLLQRGRVNAVLAVRGYALFWGLTTLALALGSLASVLHGTWRTDYARNLPALGLSAAASCLALLSPDGLTRWRTVVRAVLATITPCMVALGLLAAAGRTNLGPLATLYELRFTGWAENPNQLALVCLPLPYFGIEWLRSARGFWRRSLVLCLLLGIVGVGLATLSDALMFSWGIATMLLVAYAWWHSLAGARRTTRTVAFGVLILPATILVSVGVLMPTLERLVEERVQATYGNNSQGSDRVALWTNGIQAAIRSPLFGLGPGGYSGVTRPFDGIEAHNSYIDWLDATGLVGLTLLAGLLAWAGLSAMRAGDATAFVSLIAVCVFVMFHYVLRQPLFWCYVLAVGASGYRARLLVRTATLEAR